MPLLAHYFLDHFSRQKGKAVAGFGEEALETLSERDWPGNVRELRNVLERLMIMVPGEVITREHLNLPGALALGASGDVSGDGLQLPLHEAREQFERQYVLRVLESVGWNQSRAARLLGLHRNTLLARLGAWGIRRPGAGDEPGP